MVLSLENMTSNVKLDFIFPANKSLQLNLVKVENKICHENRFNNLTTKEKVDRKIKLRVNF